MNKYAVVMPIMFCLLVAFAILAMTEDVHAQSADQKLATREGLPDAELDESKLPGKLEIGLALGSIVAMIGVMKFV